MPNCHYCNYSCEDFKQLAQHIISVRHVHGLKWANSFLLKNVIFQDAKEVEGRIPLDDQEKQNKKDAQRELCGVEKTVLCVCPNKNCGRQHPVRIPVEFLQSPFAWRKDDKPLVECTYCNKKSHQNSY